MTYRERLERKAVRLAKWAESREQKAEAAAEAAHQATDRIEPGQPILLGHHSQPAHEKAIATQQRKLEQAWTHTEKAETFRRGAEHAEKHAARIAEAEAMGLEDYQPGERVGARFTNSGRILTFEGEIVERTLNHWKIRCLTSPLDGPENHAWYVEERRIIKIPCAGRPGHTANNRVIGRI